LLRSVEQLNRAARLIGEGALETRVENPRSLYLKPLKSEFNAMATRLQQLNENNRLMSHAVSHELRTPLSRLRFALHLLGERDNAEQREQDMLRMEADLDDMEALINEILKYARIDRQAPLNLESLDFSELLRCRVARRVEQECNIKLEAGASLMLRGDSDALAKIIDNLLQNACRHAESRVFVFAENDGDEAVITVEDDGVGVPQAERDAIFQPFHRLGSEKGGKASGFGLGLAIVARLVKAHGGSIRVDQSRDLGGACFELRLPAVIT
jgi:two-component system sensor histidine kinase RstB